MSHEETKECTINEVRDWLIYPCQLQVRIHQVSLPKVTREGEHPSLLHGSVVVRGTMKPLPRDQEGINFC